ncbi:MAG TPA: hypothetical protein VMU40_22170 [Steroidobacteraceae bacterium]|nr:hypothetical protein [Steroidobacteraceae bacterium]
MRIASLIALASSMLSVSRHAQAETLLSTAAHMVDVLESGRAP